MKEKKTEVLEGGHIFWVLLMLYTSFARLYIFQEQNSLYFNDFLKSLLEYSWFTMLC